MEATIKFYFIYLTINLIDLKIYVGQRLIRNVKSDFTYLGSGEYLKRAIRKYGKENFKREIIEYCSEKTVNNRERYWIRVLHSNDSEIGYNLTEGGDGVKGITRSLAWRIKKRNNMLGNSFAKGTIYTEEQKKRRSIIAKKGEERQKGYKTKTSKSRYIGVYWRTNRRKYWTSSITYKFKNKFVGSYMTEIEAAEAYNKKAKELYGDKVILNIIDKEC